MRKRGAQVANLRKTRKRRLAWGVIDLVTVCLTPPLRFSKRGLKGESAKIQYKLVTLRGKSERGKYDNRKCARGGQTAKAATLCAQEKKDMWGVTNFCQNGSGVVAVVVVF